MRYYFEPEENVENKTDKWFDLSFSPEENIWFCSSSFFKEKKKVYVKKIANELFYKLEDSFWKPLLHFSFLPSLMVEKSQRYQVFRGYRPFSVDLNGSSSIKAPMPGKVLKCCNKGDILEKGDMLAILEAMKMENEVKSPFKLEILEVLVKQGESIPQGIELIQFKKI